MTALVDKKHTDTLEYYGSAKEIALEDDRIDTDIHIVGWERKMRIRALSFAQMEKINKNARNKDDGKIDQEQWTYWTIKEGVIMPGFTIASAQELAENNGHFVRELAENIWELGRISQKQWNEFIEAQTKASEIEKTGNPDV